MLAFPGPFLEKLEKGRSGQAFFFEISPEINRAGRWFSICERSMDNSYLDVCTILKC
jgi:hypothetical protein